MADHDEDETPDVPSDEPDPAPADPADPDPAAPADEAPPSEEADDGEATAEAEVAADDATDDATTTADGTVVEEAPAGGRSGVVVGFVVAVAAVLALVLGVAVLGGGDDDGDEPRSEDEAAADDGRRADTTVGTPVPPVTTAPGTPTAGLLSELAPVDSDSWEPAGDDVTIGGATHAETVVSGPIGTCDDGAAQTVTYDLSGGYTWLEGVVGLVDGTDTGLAVEIGFEADGEQVWWKTFAEGESSRVQLDLTDARELTVTATALFAGVDAEEACVRAAYGDLTLR